MYFGKEINKLFLCDVGVYTWQSNSRCICPEGTLGCGNQGIFRSHCIAYDNKPKKLN